MAEPIRFGLVGCGRIGASSDAAVAKWPIAEWWLPYSHAAAIRSAKGAVLVAVCDALPEAAEAARQLHDVPAAYCDVGEMLKHERLDALAIATRTPMRMDVIRAALAAGIRGIYCEKPLSQTLEEADEVARMAPHFVYGTKRRFMPAYADVLARIQAGELGAISNVAIRFGRGPLLWTHPHTIDLASLFAGDERPEYVQADLELDLASVEGTVVDSDPVLRMAHIKYASGISAVITAAPGHDVEIAGSGGTIAIRSGGTAIHTRTPRDSDDAWLLSETMEEAPRGSGTVLGIESLVRTLAFGERAQYTVSHAVQNQEILFAMVESHLRGGARVDLPLARRGLRITGRSGELFA